MVRKPSYYETLVRRRLKKKAIHEKGGAGVDAELGK
jgi:hypothetical protein